MTDLEIVLWKASDAVRGAVHMEVWVECVLTLFLLKHAVDQEREAGGHSHAALPCAAHFDALVEVRRKPGNAARIKAAYMALEQANSGLPRKLITQSRLDALVASESDVVDRELGNLLETLGSRESDPGLTAPLGREMLVGAYEDLLRAFPAVSAENAGEHYTPREVVKFMVQLIDPRPGDSIHDPVCGSGGFLLGCADFLKKRYDLPQYTISGQEINPSSWRLAAMNALLHGEDGRRIVCGDTLREPLHLKDEALEGFDLILANPPFSVVIEDLEAIMAQDRFNRFRGVRLSKGRADFAFILHMIACMKQDTGRIATVAPQGVLFRGGGEAHIRRDLIQRNLVDAVIGLPPKLFYCTGIAAVILVLHAKRERQDVLFIDASTDYVAGRRRNELGPEQIERIVATYRNRASVSGYSRMVSPQQIADNDFNLSISRYVTSTVEDAPIDSHALAQRQEELREELGRVQEEIGELLEGLGVV